MPENKTRVPFVIDNISYQLAAAQKDVERPLRARLGASPEGLTSLELLERYLQSKEVGPERIALLLERAEAFFAAEG